jgi:hypothetical protein
MQDCIDTHVVPSITISISVLTHHLKIPSPYPRSPTPSKPTHPVCTDSNLLTSADPLRDTIEHHLEEVATARLVVPLHVWIRYVPRIWDLRFVADIPRARHHLPRTRPELWWALDYTFLSWGF